MVTSSNASGKRERKKVVLLFSGGVDTSISVKLLQEKYHLDVITCTIDLGQREYDFGERREKALRLGAIEHVILDAKEEFAKQFVLKALQANALYDSKYPVSTSLSRPLIAKKAVEVARAKGAEAVAHGCKGRGADAFRLDMVFNFLAPDLELVRPIRDWNPSRDEEVAYAYEHNIPVPVTREGPYSYDDNMWGNAINYGPIDEIEKRVPETAFRWTVPVEAAPNRSQEVTVTFERGVPIALDGQQKHFSATVDDLNRIGGKHGIGRIDMIENGLYGNKFRWVYECPAAEILIQAHWELERVVLPKTTLTFKDQVDRAWGEAAYNSFWYSPLMEALTAFIATTQRYVNGTVTFKLYKGKAEIVNRSSPNSLIKPVPKDHIDLVPYGYEEYLFASVNRHVVARALAGFAESEGI